MTTTRPIAAIATCLLATACVVEAPPQEPHASAIETPAPQRAGQPMG